MSARVLPFSMAAPNERLTRRDEIIARDGRSATSAKRSLTPNRS